ncbi:MAG: hypothetical protein LBR68_08010, partial [Lachnoclostridium sp.]|nr:hypothetical protein [Lachnoclostridium sp.]
LLSFDEETLNKFDVIIIDEDIILKGFLPNQVEMEISELKEVAKETTNSVLKNKIHQVLKAVKTKTMFTLPPVFWDNKEDGDGISTGIDIPSFCSATKFYYRKAAKEKNLSEDTLVFIKPVKLKKNVKYIMVSATVDEEICDYYFGADRVEFSECKTAAYTGTLVQYPELSMSRTCIDNHEGIIEKIKRWSGFENTITFMKYSLGPLHFGNTEGSNSMAGENIDVIGTPYEAEFLYKLAAYTLGLNFDMNAEMKPQIVNHNGFTFRFTTYEDEALRDMQFWMIESELEQAVGRARLLRYDCKVNLFSNFPLRQAELRESEY